jgi:hypothetical protein
MGGEEKLYTGICDESYFREGNPGSQEAIERGCICDPVQNQLGDGQLGGSGSRLFRPDDNCPLHGLKAVFGLVKARVANGISPKDAVCT